MGRAQAVLEPVLRQFSELAWLLDRADATYRVITVSEFGRLGTRHLTGWNTLRFITTKRDRFRRSARSARCFGSGTNTPHQTVSQSLNAMRLLCSSPLPRFSAKLAVRLSKPVKDELMRFQMEFFVLRAREHSRRRQLSAKRRHPG